MSWRVLVVASNAKVDYKMDYIVVRTVDEVRRVHISEIGILMIESTAVSITAYALCELANRKVKVIFCDHERNPQSELMLIHGSHDTSAKIRQQLRWTENSKQNVWTELVKEKICRQHRLLTKLGLTQAALLEQYLEELQLNDTTNREGHAAKVYFKATPHNAIVTKM